MCRSDGVFGSAPKLGWAEVAPTDLVVCGLLGEGYGGQVKWSADVGLAGSRGQALATTT